MVKNPPAIRETWVDPWVGNILWKRAWQPTPVFFPEESQWTKESGSPWDPKEVDMTEGLSTVQD